MKTIGVVDTIPFPIDVVFKTIREDLPKLVPHLPNIKRIEVKESEQISENHLRLLNVWHAEAPIPSIAKAYINPEMLSWKDTADWMLEERCVHWHLETIWFNKLFECKGTNYFTAPDENTTQLRITGKLDIYADVIPGIPKLFKNKISSVIEDMVVKMISPNLGSLSKGVTKYLQSKR